MAKACKAHLELEAADREEGLLPIRKATQSQLSSCFSDELKSSWIFDSGVEKYNCGNWRGEEGPSHGGLVWNVAADKRFDLNRATRIERHAIVQHARFTWNIRNSVHSIFDFT